MNTQTNTHDDLNWIARTSSPGAIRSSIFGLTIVPTVVALGIVSLTHLLPLYIWATVAKDNHILGIFIFIIGTIVLGASFSNEQLQEFFKKCSAEKSKWKKVFQIKRGALMIVTFLIASMFITSCKKEDKGPFKGAGPGDKVTGGIIVTKGNDGHGIMIADSNFSDNCAWSTAFGLCEKSNYGSYDNWRLPTGDEQQMIYENTFLKKIGNWPYQDGYAIYWGSEYTIDSIYTAVFSPKEIIKKIERKSGSGGAMVRAVRDY